MPIRAILFDKDGTLADFHATFTQATFHVLDRLAGSDQEKLAKMAQAVGYDIAEHRILESSVIIAGSGVDIAQELAPFVDRSDVHAFGPEIDRLYGQICAQTVTALPGVPAALSQLAASDYSLGIATNDSQENAKLQAQRLGIDKLMAVVFGADSGFGPKPGPGMVTGFIEQTGFDCAEILMVGDSLHDLEAGRRAGAKTLGVATGPASKESLEPHADWCLPSVAELPQFMKTLDY
ncbi:MAG: HAD family hydrolase [Pseudomonadota bacterium]